MLKIQLKSVFGEVLFEYESEGNTLKKTVEKFLKEKEGTVISRLDLSGRDLSGIEFDNSTFDNSTFYNSTFDNSTFYNSTFYNSTFDNSKFDTSTFYNSTFYNSTFDNSTFDNSTFYNSKLYSSTFDNSTFDNSKFYNSKFDTSTFTEETVKNILKNGQQFIFDNAKNDFFSILLKSIPEIPGLQQALREGQINGSTYSGECCCLVGTIAKVKSCSYTMIPGIVPDAGRPAELWFVHIMPGMTPENSEKVKLTLDWIDEFLTFLPKQ